jgi:glutamate synthase domain-containing protein 2
MVEIQVGQGARGGIGRSRKHDLLSPRVKALLGLAEGEDAVAHARLPGITSSRQLARLVKELRDATDGLPIAIKIAAGWTLEEDLKVAIDSGVDVVTVDGGQGATRDSIPALLDDFGLPTVAAVRRTHDFLVNQKVRDRVSVIISGGLRTPGDFLKALALGADAVAIGTMALFAVSHTQILKALPFEPPTQLVYDAGSLSHKFDVEKGALYLANFLSSCVDEMRECVRALGKTALSEVGREDMYALDERTAKITGVPFIGDFVYR